MLAMTWLVHSIKFRTDIQTWGIAGRITDIQAESCCVLPLADILIGKNPIIINIEDMLFNRVESVFQGARDCFVFSCEVLSRRHFPGKQNHLSGWRDVRLQFSGRAIESRDFILTGAVKCLVRDSYSQMHLNFASWCPTAIGHSNGSYNSAFVKLGDNVIAYPDPSSLVLSEGFLSIPDRLFSICGGLFRGGCGFSSGFLEFLHGNVRGLRKTIRSVGNFIRGINFVLGRLCDFFSMTGLSRGSLSQIVCVDSPRMYFVQSPTRKYGVEESGNCNYEGKNKLPAIMGFSVGEVLVHERLKSRGIGVIGCLLIGILAAAPSLFYLIASFIFGVQRGNERFVILSPAEELFVLSLSLI